MNKIFLHLWLFALCGSLLHSCSQNEAVPEVEYPENEMESPENEVKFQASEGVSRSFIEGNHLSTANTSMCIYGYKDNVPLAQSKGDKVLTGKTLKYNGTAWSVVDNTEDQNPITYYWEGNGKYRFFGWLTYDAKSRKTIPTGLTLTDSDSDGKFTITDMVINKDYSQFDFLYSNINYRELTSGNFNQEKTKSVAMEMNHLFTAFAIGIKNTSEDDIVIKSVKLNCVHDKGSAVIDFSKSVTENVTDKTTSSVLVTAQYGTSKETSNPFNTFSGEHTLPNKNGFSPDIFQPSATDTLYYMVWPQQGTVLNADGFSLGEDDEEEDAKEANTRDANSPLLLEYTVDGVPFKKRLRLPNENWLPGKKYYLEVQIADKLVEVTSTVKDWYYTDSKVDFSQQSVSVKQGNHLMWDPNTCTIDEIAKEVEVKYGKNAVGTFTIDAPLGGQWKVSLVGDITAFQIVDLTAPTNDGQGPIDGKSHSITIVPLITTPERDYKVTLKFVAITVGGRTFAADDMVQKDIYTIVQRRVK